MKKILFLFTILFAGSVFARDQVKIVGSSTVYPFATVVAERFGKTSGYKTPVIESTGSGGGLKLFCAGVGTKHPDICLLYTSPSPRDLSTSRMPSSA